MGHLIPFRTPPLTGECCHCQDCVVAGVTDKPVVRTPNGELHGVELRRWYESKARFDAAMKALVNRRMP